MMQRNLDSRLSELHQQLLTMAGYAEQAIGSATEAWRLRNLSKIQSVYAIEEKVNQAQISIDDVCFKLIALQQPLATDLRLIIASIKINTDLERVVDLAVNIVKNTEYYLKAPPIGHLNDLAEMSDEVILMMREVLDAFVRADESQARNVLVRDDKVDALKDKIFRDVQEHMMQDASAIHQGLNVILIARNLERIGDHATNIAEDVIFAISGEDIRHPGRPAKIKGAE